jgi:formylmethanofuran:tetrahydromethanopterin formyltransferase
MQELVGDYLIYRKQVQREAHIGANFMVNHAFNTATAASAQAAVVALQEAKHANSKAAVEKAAAAAAKKFDTIISRLNPCNNTKHRLIKVHRWNIIKGRSPAP